MDLVDIPLNPVPDGAVTGSLRTRDKVNLRFARWRPPPGRKGTVCVLQGRAEFIEKYFEVIGELQARGFAVATFDWRGQGLSERAMRDARKGHVRSFAEYDRDLDAFMNDVVLPDCPPPYFALGHSMGCAVLLRAAHEGRRWFDRMVFTAPMIGLTGAAAAALARSTTRFMRLAGLGGSYVPGGGATSISSLPFAGNILTSDPVRYARASSVIDALPALGLGAPTVAWLDAAYKVMAGFADGAYPRKIQQAILILAPGLDQVVSATAIDEFAIRLRAGAHLVIPGSRHELLMEQDRYRSQFWAAFDAFVPGSSSG